MAAQIWLALLLTTFRMLPKMDRRSTLPVPMDGILAPAEGENELRMECLEWIVQNGNFGNGMFRIFLEWIVQNGDFGIKPSGIELIFCGDTKSIQ